MKNSIRALKCSCAGRFYVRKYEKLKGIKKHWIWRTVFMSDIYGKAHRSIVE